MPLPSAQEPNKDDPLNKEAGKVMHENRDLFLRVCFGLLRGPFSSLQRTLFLTTQSQNVAASMQGRAVDGITYDRVK